MTTRPPACSDASAISGLPITTVTAFSGSLMSLAWSRITETSAAGAGRGAMTATAQNARTSARIRRLNTNAIELSRALRIGRQLQAAAEWAGLRFELTRKW